MKRILLLFSLMFFANSFSQKQIFTSPDLKNKIATHKKVAILPFSTTITYKKQPKNFSVEANREQEMKMSKSIQSSMYTFLLRKSSKYTVYFQDVDETNILLKKAGVEDKLDEMTKAEIAKILGVDAVIGGKFEQEQSRSEVGAVITGVLFGLSKTGSGSLTMTINDAENSDLLWRFFYSMDDDVFSSTDVLVERMMRKVSRNFPYTK